MTRIIIPLITFALFTSNAFAAGDGDGPNGEWGGGNGGKGSSGSYAQICYKKVFVSKTCYNKTTVPAKMVYGGVTGNFADFSNSMQFTPAQDIFTPYECGSYSNVKTPCPR